MQNSKHFPRDTIPDPRFRGEEKFFFRFPKMYWNSTCSNAEFINCPGTKLRIFVLGGGKFVFVLQKFNETLLQIWKILKFPPGTILRTPFYGKGKFVSIRRKCTKTLLYSNTEFKNSLGDNTPDPRFQGRRSLFSFSEKVPKLSYSNAEFHNKSGGRTAVFGKRRWKLPPLEIMSGYAPAGPSIESCSSVDFNLCNIFRWCHWMCGWTQL